MFMFPELIKGIRTHSNIKQAMMSSLLYKKVKDPLNGIDKADVSASSSLYAAGVLLKQTV